MYFSPELHSIDAVEGTSYLGVACARTTVASFKKADTFQVWKGVVTIFFGKMTSFGPILLPQAAALILQHLTEQAVIPGTKIIYSDGSLLHAGSPEASLAFGVVHSVSNINFSVRGCTDCHASSTKGELVELLAAILSAPLNQKIDIQFDNQAVDHQFTSLVSNRSSTLPSQWLWCPFARLWSVIHLLVQARGQEGHVLVTCVQGHANNADGVAGAAARSNITNWTLDLSAQTEVSFFALCHDQLLEAGLRDILKQ
ncbi:MAG: hypothetical protein BYD32DRAFT_434553 [Podila humilis]|nr:MAG: hypothetical protein BYD32DRAFT_434553 [Podila humilis]